MTRPAPAGTDQVVLLDDAGYPIGTADKATVHTHNTPLHLAFSCYVFDSENRLLLTQRAQSKKTWPGVWTNTCCGHPAPGEALADAVHRRLKTELDLVVATLDLILPTFRYRAVMDDGTVENEICPVYRATTHHCPRPNPAEVTQTRWVLWPEFLTLANTQALTPVSPWLLMQVEILRTLDADPRRWPTAPDLYPGQQFSNPSTGGV